MRSSIRFFTASLMFILLALALPGRASAHGWGWGWGGGWHGGWGGGWGVGIGIGVPLVVPGPYYYPAPAYYPPPPAYYAPPPPPPGYISPYPGFIQQMPASSMPPEPVQSSAGTAAESCNAGNYVCPMEVTVPAGNRCYCRGNDGERVYGTAQ